MKIDKSATIQKSPVDVFRIVSDLKYTIENIDPDVVSVEKISEGPIRVGTRWIQTLKVPMSTVIIDMEVTRMTPGKSFDVDFKSKGMTGDVTFSFEPNGDGTDFSLHANAKVRGLGWLMYPMIRMDFPRREQRRVGTLKRLVESGEMDPTQAEPAAEMT